MTDIEGDQNQNPEAAPRQPPTGNAAIDEALTRLDRLPDLEFTEHPEQFDAIHRVLRESLTGSGADGDLTP